MKTDHDGQSTVAARTSPNADETASPMKPPLRGALVAIAIFVVVAVAAIIARHPIAGFILSRALSVGSNERVTFRSFVLGRTQITVDGLHAATPDGEPLLDLGHLELRYSLRDLLPGGRRRLGLIAVAIDGATFTVVRHTDGSYNIRTGGSSAGGAGTAKAAPLILRVRVRNGTIRLIDRAPTAPDLGQQVMRGITVDAQIDSAGRSRATGKAMWLSRREAGAAVEAWPVALGALGDTARGLLIVRAHATLLPLRGGLGYVQHSPAVRIAAGMLHDLDLRVFALNVGLGQPLDLHVGGRADLTDGRLKVGALQRPVRAVAGRLALTDDGVWSTRLTGKVAGIPIVARGGFFDRTKPRVQLGIAADGDLADLRTIFGFSRKQPVVGRVHVETVIEAPAANILIRSALRIPRGSYGSVPLTDVAGRVDYHAATVVLDAVHGRYGASNLEVGGRFLLGGPALDSAIALAATGPGRALPYAENLAPEAAVDVVALITGGGAGYRARGALGLNGADVVGRGMFSLDERGVGEYGPFTFERSDGSSLIGALRLERPTSQSAAWISARGYHVAVPANAARLVGLATPAFPPVAGIIDASLAGGGSPAEFDLAGRLTGRDLQVGNAVLGTGQAQLGGSLRDLRLSGIGLAGPLGRFRGSAAVAAGTFAMRGDYDGSLERLRPLTGEQFAHGAVRGPVLATLGGGDIVVQSAGAAMRGDSIRGVGLDRAAGTLAVRGKTFHLIVAEGSIGGRRAIARESQGTVAVSAPDLPSAALRGTGLPLEAGNLSVYGVADLRGRAPRFAGTVAVAGGRARGYRVAGDAQLDLAGGRATIHAATGALGSTYGSIGGSIDGVGARALRYDLQTLVPLGDIDLLRRDLGLPVRYLEGSFGAQLHVHGSGTQPFVDGTIDAPEGSYNGLAFVAASTHLVLDSYGLTARGGTLTVGSTRTAVAASAAGGKFAFAASAPQANLADFNDYFDASDTLAGQGAFDLALRTYGGRIDTHGHIALSGLRYRRFPLGTTVANWHMNGPAIAGQVAIGSVAGTLAATGSIIPAGIGDPVRAFGEAGYDIRATLGRIDLGTWLPAAGFSQPVLGEVDARLQITGRRPRLALGVDATLTGATVAGYPIRAARLRASSSGTRVNVAASSADLGFAKLAGNGKFGWTGSDPIAFDLRATTDDVSRALRLFVPAARGLDLAGALDADVRIGGTRAKPTVEGGFDLSNARYGGFAVPRAIGSLALAGTSLELRDADVEFTRGQAFVAGSLPLHLQPFGLGPPRAPVSFDVTARSVDLAQFSPLLPAGTKLGGTIDGRFGVEGTVERPRMLGALAIADGSYLSTFERAPIAHFDARLAFAGTSVALETFHAGVGSGTLDAGGRITLPFGADPHTSYALDVRAKAAQLDFPAFGRGTLDGALRLTGGTGRPLVSGTIALRNAVIPVTAVYGSGSASGSGSNGMATIDPTLGIHASVANNVRVRSGIVDIGVTGAVDVTGTLRAPRLAGAFTATDGTVSSYNHVFRVVNASAIFNPADGILPTIDARASARVTNPDPDPSRNIAGSANIIVTVAGTPDSNNLQVTYSSDPPYSQEQIVGLLLDVPALLGAVNFNLNGGPGVTLRGAPGETNVLLPPGVSPEQVSAISFNQEVFSLLNGQFTQRALTPIEHVFEKVFGLSDLEFTVDYGGGLGYSLRRQIGKRDFYAFLSQTVTYPERSNFGFELEPKPFETLNFSYYQQNGVTSLITNQNPGSELFSGSTRRFTSVQPLGNRSGFSLNFNRRF